MDNMSAIFQVEGYELDANSRQNVNNNYNNRKNSYLQAKEIIDNSRRGRDLIIRDYNAICEKERMEKDAIQKKLQELYTGIDLRPPSKIPHVRSGENSLTFSHGVFTYSSGFQLPTQIISESQADIRARAELNGNERREREREEDTRELIPLSGSFYARRKKTMDIIKSIRIVVAAKEKPYIPKMTKQQNYYIRTVIRNCLFSTFFRRPLYKKEALKRKADELVDKASSCNRGLLFMYGKKDFGDYSLRQIYAETKGVSLTDKKALNMIIHLHNQINSKCGYENIFNINDAKITRNGVEKKEIVSITFVCQPAADLLAKNPHIIFIDACYDSDYGNTLLAVYLDCNHHVQPFAFQISPTENTQAWHTFLKALLDAGVDYDDLVINSDRSPDIRNAVEKVYPHAEHTYCFVHFERNLQNKWKNEYGAFSVTNTELVKTFNHFMDYLYLAKTARTKEVCDKYLDMIKRLESNYNKYNEYPVYDYMKEEVGGFLMHSWSYTHLLQVTNNPVEICMNELNRPRYKFRACREECLYNQIRYLILWIYECLDRRYFNLHCDNYEHPSSFQPPVNYMESLVINFIHTYYCSKQYYTIKTRSGGAGGNLTSKYIVHDKTFGEKFEVDLRDKTCSCNVMHWTKHVCIHVVAVLCERGEYSRIWDFVDPIYTIESVKETCRLMTAEERKVWDYILAKNNYIDVEEVVNEDYRNERQNIIKNKRRLTCRGEKNDKLIVCFINYVIVLLFS